MTEDEVFEFPLLAFEVICKLCRLAYNKHLEGCSNCDGDEIA